MTVSLDLVADREKCLVFLYAHSLARDTMLSGRKGSRQLFGISLSRRAVGAERRVVKL